jgi:hypothetical protein
MTVTFDLNKVELAHQEALFAAQRASLDFVNRYMNGKDGGACGFGWVDVFGVRSNSKLGKILSQVGFTKSYSGSLQLWNKWYYGQSVDAAEAGAVAYADKFKEVLGLDRVYAGSRLD